SDHQGAKARSLMLARLARLWRRPPAAAPAPGTPPVPPPPTPTFDADVAATGLSTIAWCRRRRETGALHADLPGEALAALQQSDAGRTGATIAAAERLLRHDFDLLGSGSYRPIDPDRRPRDGYTPIDWYLDPVRRLRFPRGVPHKQWNLME